MLSETLPARNRYGLAILAIAVSTFVTFALRPVLGPQTHYLTFTLAVIVSAWYGGLGPGLTATVVGFLSADYFFIEPLYSLLPVDGEDLALLGSVGVSVSVLTERLSSAQTQLSVATSAAGIGILEWRIRKDRVRGTPQLAKLYGISPQSLTGTLERLLDHLYPEDAPRVAREIREALKAGKREIVQEFRIIRPDEKIRWVEARCRIFYDNPGVPTRAVSAHIDITERRNRELERERLIQQAEQARSALTASNEDLQRFAYAISHDLQQPLRTIGIYSELLLRQAAPLLDPESSQIARTIVNGVDQMRELISGLLRFCRATHEHFETEQTADTNVVLKKAIAHLEAAIQESGAKITVDQLPVVRMNEEQLLQVLLNLVGNAIKYRIGKPPEIHVSACREVNAWRLAVSDNGIGIDPKDQEHIFGFLHRLHSASEYEGIGLGLALVRRIVERSGGRVWVDSEPGKGSTFSFTIPEKRHEN
jgi:PAS domain S-box-containing protein